MSKRLWDPTFSLRDLIIYNSEIKFNNQRLTVLDEELSFKLYGGDHSPIVHRLKVVRSPVVAILLYHLASRSVVLIEECRSTSIGDKHKNPWILDVVAGMIEENEECEIAAKREAQEEAGCEVEKLIFIDKFLPSCGLSNEMVYAYCGLIKNLPINNIHGCNHEMENIKTFIFSLAEVKNLLTQKKIITASALITINWLLLNQHTF